MSERKLRHNLDAAAIMCLMSRLYSAASQTLTHEEFLSQRDPGRVEAEMAAMRTLAVEFRQSMEDAGAEKAGRFFTDVDMGWEIAFRTIEMQHDLDRETLNDIRRVALETLTERFAHHYPIQSRISAKDAETMSKLLKNIVDCAEKYRKIFDNMTVKMDWDQTMIEMMRRFFQLILPHIAPAERPFAAEKVVKFLPRAITGLAVPDEEGV